MRNRARRRRAPDSPHRPANIGEQFSFLRKWINRDVRGLVTECMAVKPRYQLICQRDILKSPVSVITNVRLDHQEEMGDTLEDIARSLCSTIPHHGTVITGERNPELREVIQEEADKRGSEVVFAEESELSRSMVKKFNYHQFEENVAVALAVADTLGIDHETACEGMIAAKPDPGTITVTEAHLGDGKELFWVQRRPARCRPPDAAGGGFPEANIVCSNDFDENCSGRDLIDRAIDGIDNDKIALFGMVNIHTEQVTKMRHYVDALVEARRARWQPRNRLPCGIAIHAVESCFHNPGGIHRALDHPLWCAENLVAPPACDFCYRPARRRIPRGSVASRQHFRAGFQARSSGLVRHWGGYPRNAVQLVHEAGARQNSAASTVASSTECSWRFGPRILVQDHFRNWSGVRVVWAWRRPPIPRVDGCGVRVLGTVYPGRSR